MAQISISELSQTISELIDLDLEQQSSILTAIDRALDARQVVGGKRPHVRDIGGGSGAHRISRGTYDIPLHVGLVYTLPGHHPDATRLR